MVLNDDGSIPDKLEANPGLLQVAKIIGRHADFVVIPSNTPHLFEEEIRDADGKNILSIVDVTIEEVEKRNLRTVGVLAFGVTLKNRLYQNRLDELGIYWKTIPEGLVEELDESIRAYMEGKESEDLRKVTIEAIQTFRNLQTDGIILGCTEIPLILKEPLDEDLINPVQLLAEAAVKRALGKD